MVKMDGERDEKGVQVHSTDYGNSFRECIIMNTIDR